MFTLLIWWVLHRNWLALDVIPLCCHIFMIIHQNLDPVLYSSLHLVFSMIIPPPPPQTVYVGGYTVFTLSESLTNRPTDRVSVTFCFLNILKNHRWNFIKFCKHIRMYKANTTDEKLRARGQYYWSYFPL